jgi:hypothetical protein
MTLVIIIWLSLQLPLGMLVGRVLKRAADKSSFQ